MFLDISVDKSKNTATLLQRGECDVINIVQYSTKQFVPMTCIWGFMYHPLFVLSSNTNIISGIDTNTKLVLKEYFSLNVPKLKGHKLH